MGLFKKRGPISSCYPGIYSTDTLEVQRPEGKQGHTKESCTNQGCNKVSSTCTLTDHGKDICSHLFSLLFLTMCCEPVTKCNVKCSVAWVDDLNMPCSDFPVGGMSGGDAKDKRGYSQFLLDSGAARHCSGNKPKFKNFKTGNFGNIIVADGTSVPVTGLGSHSKTHMRRDRWL